MFLSISKLGKFFRATRPFSLICSLFPIVAGYIIANEKRNGGASLAILSFIATAILLVHAAANLLNTYFDFLAKVSPISTLKFSNVHH